METGQSGHGEIGPGLKLLPPPPLPGVIAGAIVGVLLFLVLVCLLIFFLKKRWALAGVAQWSDCRPANKGWRVRFPLRAHAWVAGQVFSRGRVRDNHTLMFLSFSLPSPLSKNK